MDRFSRFFISLPRILKRIVAIFVDISFCTSTVWVAFYLRLGEVVRLSGPVLDAVVLSVAIALPIFVISGLYRVIFRYTGFRAVTTIIRAIAGYGIIYGSVITVFGLEGVPRTVGLIQPLLLFIAVSSSRVLVRTWLGGAMLGFAHTPKLPKALVYGAGSAGRQLVSALENSTQMQVIGFLDDDQYLQGHFLNGRPIFSPNELGELIESKGATHLLLAIPSASRRLRNQLLSKVSGHRIIVRTLPSLTDLTEGRVTTSDLRELDIDDVLNRDPVSPNKSLLLQNIKNRSVLVTGAGGSIGSELCRQIVKLGPKKLILIDISEFGLYSIHAELEELCETLADCNVDDLVPVLASVQDEERMRVIMETWCPNTVYHAAAYKHVPLVEHNVIEGVRNNVLGTLVLAQISIEKRVSDFVLISTDKAVRPTNVMGASKRLAEICLQALCASQRERDMSANSSCTSFANPIQIGTTKFSMVRFGNVLDSSGSVIPKFRRQIRDGGPLTLTHPEITRYFMTIPEAAELVIQAGAMSKGGDVFILDMGSPVKIADLARRIIELSGLSVRDDNNPDGDIEIVLSGLRPGEKLYEELMLGDNPLPTMHPKIQRAQDPFICWRELEADLQLLRSFISKNDVEAVLDLLQKIVPDYSPSGHVVDWIYARRKTTINLK